MKISDLIRGPSQPVVPVVHVVQVHAQPEPQEPSPEQAEDDAELLRMKQIAGLLGGGPREYSNSPEQKTATVASVLASGDDVHRSKHPSDIRSNSISMYPNFQAKG